MGNGRASASWLIIGQLSFGFDNSYRCGVDIWGSKGSLRTNRLFTARADFEPVFEISTSKGIEDIRLASDDHFLNVLKYFYQLHGDQALQREENQRSLDQARLLEDIRRVAGC